MNCTKICICYFEYQFKIFLSNLKVLTYMNLCSFYASVDEYSEICKEQKDWWTNRIKQINTWLEHKPKKS